MSETRAILEDSAARLFAEYDEPALLRRVEEGEWPPEIWAGIAAMGFELIFGGGSDDPWNDACSIAKACGRHAVPAPLAEHLAAGALLAEAGIAAEGPMTLAPLGATTLEFNGSEGYGSVSGAAAGVAWGRHARVLVAVATGGSETMLVALPISAATVAPSRNIGREPRDGLNFSGAAPLAVAPVDPARVEALGALFRAAQLAGAIEAVLDMTVLYAKERVQFGKPIGSFQAVQQQLAILAGHSAAATRAVDAAFARAGEGGDLVFEAAVAKARAGEAGGVAAEIAHQVHGAIGFTDEHRLHYATRRIWSWRAEFGTEARWSAHLGRLAAASGGEGFWPMITAAG